MKASDIYSSPFLRAADLQKPVKLTISDLEIGSFTDQRTQQEQRRVVVGFDGAKKRLILNKTNAGNLAAAFGDELAAWPGKSVILAPGVAANGQPTVLASAAPEERPQSEGDDSIPF